LKSFISILMAMSAEIHGSIPTGYGNLTKIRHSDEPSRT